MWSRAGGLRTIYKFGVKSLYKIVPFMSVLDVVHPVRNCDKKFICNTSSMYCRPKRVALVIFLAPA